MFDINKAVQKQGQLNYDRLHGLPDKPRDYQELIAHIDGDIYDVQAGRESSAIKRAFKNKSRDFGLRLKKQYRVDGDSFPTGQKHRLVGRNS